MKKNQLKFVVMGVLFLQSCTIGHTSYISSVPVDDSVKMVEATDPEKKIDLFFGEATKPDRPYRQLAYVEATGHMHAQLEELIELLKKEARKYDADAIIAIKRSTTGREIGYTFDGQEDTPYQAPVFSGIAIKYHPSENN